MAAVGGSIVSIRASAKDATDEFESRYHVMQVSIRASAKDATKAQERYDSVFAVSIRASAKDATVRV